MKLTQTTFAAGAEKAARDCLIFFFCGPDEGGAAAAAERIAGLLPEAGERIELSGADLRKDPVRLADEARSTSLFGDARHLHVRASGDEAHDAVQNLLQLIDAGEGAPCPVLVVATSATDKSRTAKLLEKRADAMVGMFYPPKEGDLAREIAAYAHTVGLNLHPGAALEIARGCGLDIRLARSEIDKLALYLDADPMATRKSSPEALAAIGAATGDSDLQPIVNAALGGDTQRLAGELRRLREQGLSPVGVALALERRAAQLAGLSARLGQNRDIGGFLDAEQRTGRVFFKDRPALERQLRCWRSDMLGRLIQRLIALHRALITNGAAAETLLAQELTRITRQAQAGRQGGA